jgi:hypothetical protein
MNLKRLLVRLAILFAVAICLILRLYSPAFAEGECKGDIARFCKGTTGPKKEIACLKKHKEQLSPQCKMHIVQVLEAVVEAHQDCEPEIYAFCPGVEPGGGHIMRCLKTHKTELSPACKAGIMDVLMSR